MTNYEVAVMNYPLFYQNTPEDASIRLLSPPFHTDEGGPWETSMYIHIPFCGSSFRGCICAIVYQGREYRLATYRGVKVQAFTPEHICLSQGSLLLELDITSPHTGHPLRAPQCGKMSSTIRESCNVHLQARLWERGKAIFSLQSDHAAYEFVPNHGT